MNNGQESVTDKTDVTLQNGLTANSTGGIGSSNVQYVHTNDIDYASQPNLLNISSTSYMWDAYEPKKVVDVKVTNEVIEITYIQRAKFTYTTTINVSIGSRYQITNNDRVFKEIYGCSDGKLTLLKTVNGRINPPILEETYDFEGEE